MTQHDLSYFFFLIFCFEFCSLSGSANFILWKSYVGFDWLLFFSKKKIVSLGIIPYVIKIIPELKTNKFHWYWIINTFYYQLILTVNWDVLVRHAIHVMILYYTLMFCIYLFKSALYFIATWNENYNVLHFIGCYINRILWIVLKTTVSIK